jgi:hypothetical protein
MPVGSNRSGGLREVEPSIRMSPRDKLASESPSIGRQTVFTLAGFYFMAALISVGATFAWQSKSISPNEVDVAAEQSGSRPPGGQVSVEDAVLPQSVPVTQTAPQPAGAATSPEFVQQLTAMARDLAVVRHGVEQLAAKQEQLAAGQQHLEQLAAKQEQLAAGQQHLEQLAANQEQLAAVRQQLEQLAATQERLAAKQEQTAQNIGKTPVVEQNITMAPVPPRRNAPKVRRQKIFSRANLPATPLSHSRGDSIQ